MSLINAPAVHWVMHHVVQYIAIHQQCMIHHCYAPPFYPLTVISMIIHLFPHYEILFCLKIQFCINLLMSNLLQCLCMTSATSATSATQLCDHIVFQLLCHLSIIAPFTGEPCAWLNSSLMFSPASQVPWYCITWFLSFSYHFLKYSF